MKSPIAAGGRWQRVIRRSGTRFNQAFLVAPEQSVVYHGLAAVAQIRFNDLAFAEELFRIAGKQPNPLKMLNADYGRVLLVAKRPKEAQPVLEQAVKDTPDFGDAWINLAWARQQNGDACRLRRSRRSDEAASVRQCERRSGEAENRRAVQMSG